MQKEPVPSSRDELKKYRRQMARSACFALAALIVIIIACLAWFMNNTRVSGTLGSISASGSMFELGSVGSKGAYDNISVPGKFTSETGTEWAISDQQGRRTEVNNVVQWQLTGQSNIGNYTESGKTAAGIQPGSSGKLQFYVIPKVDGELRLKFHLDLIPLKKGEGDTAAEYTDSAGTNISQTLKKLLQGHIMLFYESKGENNQAIQTWIPSDTEDFTMTFSGKEPQLVTLEWKWPYLWKNIEENIRKKITDDETKYIPYFFYPESGNQTSTNEDTQNLLYNNADTFIGENADWLLVRLSAQPY